MGFILSFFFPPLGLTFSIRGFSESKKLEGSGRGLSIAGIIISSVVLIIAILLLLLVANQESNSQESSRDTQRRAGAYSILFEIKTHRLDNNDRLPSEEAFKNEILDGADLGYYDTSGTELVTSNTDTSAESHILCVQSGQPAAKTYYPGVNSLHIWGGSLCSSETLPVGETYGDNAIQPADTRDSAIVYRLEGTEEPQCID